MKLVGVPLLLTFPLAYADVVVLECLVVGRGARLVGRVGVLGEVGVGQRLLCCDPAQNSSVSAASSPRQHRLSVSISSIFSSKSIATGFAPSNTDRKFFFSVLNIKCTYPL